MKIYVGQQTPEHKRDTSRELMDMWKESNLCEVIEGENLDYFLWAREPGDILLYEYDRWDVFPGLPQKWNHGLFGGMQSPDERAKPWIYWPRRPRLLEQKIKDHLPRYSERYIKSIFLGKVENPVQQANRCVDNWFGVIDKFSMPIKIGDSYNWPYSQQEYLDIVATAKFGLCLPGYGPKCNREIEYFGLGVVPIFSKDVCAEYFNPLIEGEHYFRVESSEQIPDVISSCSERKWHDMSYNGQKWYEQNCSRFGSFNTTMSVIDSINGNKK